MKSVEGLPLGMVQFKAPVLAHRRMARDHYLMRLSAPLVARRALPGQFVHVRCGKEGSPLLRRPFSLLDVNPKTGTIDFIYKVVGVGTRVLADVRSGERVDLLGPLGRPFEFPSHLENADLIGGGVGIPPMVFLGRWLRERGVEVEAFLGARTKEWVICVSDFKRLKIPVRIATDDGTLGRRGSVVELLKTVIARRPERPTKQSYTLYICGPTPMMRAAANLARQRNLPAQVSLEERMGCAMGCCMGCVVEVTTEPVASHARFQRVCTEGPVFPAEAICWR